MLGVSPLVATRLLDTVVASDVVTVSAPTLTTNEFERYRRELTGYCYRMLGSGFEADDAVQETMVRAWRAADSFEGRSSMRSWLYRIATNVCLDQLRGQQRRARPMELGPSSPPVVEHLTSRPDNLWVSPIADDRVMPLDADPAEIAAYRESIRLAFVTALQHLPPRQRAVLILCEVLRWQATEAAELLGTTVAAVNSALQRARATLAALHAEGGHSPAVAAGQQELLARYVDAFERYDVARLVRLLHDDAVQSMPPYAMWLQGADDIVAWMLGPGFECEGSRLVPTSANGCPAFAQYRRDGKGGYRAWALQIIEISGERISGIQSFLDTEHIFPLFGLPLELPA